MDATDSRILDQPKEPEAVPVKKWQWLDNIMKDLGKLFNEGGPMGSGA